MTLPATITATVAPSTIDKVGRLFNGTPVDVLHELLQNARRAGATRVDIVHTDLAGHPSLIVSDDGRGIDDPRMLLTLGASDWNDETRAREDPAGMGVFSMAGLRVEYRSWSASAGQGWRAVIEAEAWSGRRPVAIDPFEIKAGTEIVIDMPEGWDVQIERAVGTATRFCPLAVTYQGVACERHDWLAGALRIENWQGSRIGIFHETQRDRTSATINFHGVTVPLTLPSVGEVDRGLRWSARIDIDDTPGLQLVLPARKEVVRTPFIEEVKQACEVAIFRAIKAGGAHRLSFVDHQRARAHGIELGEADPMLYRWTPMIADSGNRYRGEATRRPMIRMTAYEPPFEQTLTRAMAQAGDDLLCLVDEEPGFEGYGWYDALERVVDLRIRARRGEAEHVFTSLELVEIESGPVDDLVFDIDIEAADGSKRTVSLTTDVAVVPVDAYASDLDNVRVLVAPDPQIEVPALGDMLVAAAFSPSDDSDSDSYETQRDYFDREATQLARTLLIGEDAGILGRAIDRVQDHIRWLVPEGRRLLIATGRDETLARFEDRPDAFADEEAFTTSILKIARLDVFDLPAALSQIADIRTACRERALDLMARAATKPTAAGKAGEGEGG